MTPKDYIEAVDKTYLECKQKRLSRFSDEWDKFSRKINKERLEAIKFVKSEKVESFLNQCLSYWFNRSELLELHSSKSNFFGISKKKKLAKEGKKIRKDILNGKIDSTLGTSGIVNLFTKHHRMTPLKGAF